MNIKVTTFTATQKLYNISVQMQSGENSIKYIAFVNLVECLDRCIIYNENTSYNL